MKLDKSHLDQFEDIAPPMRDALTIPVEGVLGGLVIYVCASPFHPATREDVLKVAQALELVEEVA